MNQETVESNDHFELIDFREKLEFLENKLNASVQQVIKSQQDSHKKLESYLKKLPITDTNRRYILSHFEKEQDSSNQNSHLIQELNNALEEMLELLKEK